ncbi:LysE family translocator [Schumannella sp. 10F1B-5-1]|uniref:LysE family translocator n=1 Tax=Schumannella sp. 10F1B-5-1 TaxID=2590780 RepID=UPI001130A7E5|nr:LysE family translocator [Schumannella sp. 10F1B-5-1]TPW70126.1 LysE family translocator [Schumannella sp. 10F1B-5-1]
MTFWQAIAGFTVVAALLTIIPGLDSTLVLRSALTKGRAVAIATGGGIASGAMVWGVAAAVGASALLAASELAYRLLTLAGALYMVFLGISLIVKTFRRGGLAEPDVPAVDTRGRHPLLRAWLTGATTNLLNPKVGVFYIATIPQFIPHGSSPILMGLVLALVHNLLSAVWFAGLIAASSFAARWLRHPRATRIIDRVTGTVLVGFGVKLVVSPH